MMRQSIFEDIPIENLCVRVTSGSTPLRSRRDYYEQGTIDWYKTAELNDWYLEPAKERITTKALKESSAKVFPANTVLMAMYGDGRTITTLGLLRSPAATNQACSAMLVDEQKCDPLYFFYALKSRRHILLKLAYGGAQRNLTAKLIKEFALPVPPLHVQRRIAGILSAYDDLIENNQRRIKILEEMARSLYREWFVNFRFPGHEKVPLVDLPFGRIPKGWAVKTLGEMCSVTPGFAFKSESWEESGVPVIKIKNIQSDNTVDTSETDFVSEDIADSTQEKFHLKHGDFLLAMTGATAGKVGRLRSLRPMLLNQRVAKILPHDGFGSFVWCAISSEESKDRFFRLADGAAQPNMSGFQIERIKLASPANDLVESFSKMTDAILIQTDILYLKNLSLRRARDLLLPKLISGQLTVCQVDMWPAVFLA